jgi:membrane protease subunit HflC
MRKPLLIIVALLVVLWLQSGLFAVDQAEFAYQTRFGEPTATYNGASDAGLHWKLPWPIDSVQRIDRRLQVFDLPPTESLTRDPQKRTVDKTLAVDAFVCWRIPDSAAVDRFIRTVGTPEQARRLLTTRITGRLAAVVSNMPLDELVQVDDAGSALGVVSSGVVSLFDGDLQLLNEQALDRRMDRIRRRLLGLEPVSAAEPSGGPALPELALKDYGIEVVDVRLRRFNYPEAVRSSIAERIRSERNRKVADYQSEGERLARDILSAAERDAAKTVSDARAEKQRIEGLADVEADEIRNQAHAKDREFYTFLQKLKAYQAMLSETRDVLLLSSRNELFDLLLKPPANGSSGHGPSNGRNGRP